MIACLSGEKFTNVYGSTAPYSLICLSLFCCTFTFIYCAGAAENNLEKQTKKKIFEATYLASLNWQRNGVNPRQLMVHCLLLLFNILGFWRDMGGSVLSI